MLQCGIGVGGCDMASVRANTRFAPTSMVRRCPRRTIGHGVAMWHRCGRTRGSPLHPLSVGAYGAPLAMVLQCGFGAGGCDMASVRANTRFAPTSMVRRCIWRTTGYRIAMWYRCGRTRGSPLHPLSVGVHGAQPHYKAQWPTPTALDTPPQYMA